MKLIVDAGNTCIKVVVFDGRTPVDITRIDDGDAMRLTDFAARYDIDGGIVSTVVRLSDEMEKAIESLPFPMMRLGPGETPVPVKVCYATPRTLGADRLAAAVGAYVLGGGRDVLVIDIGTCITYDFVTAAGEYLGGNISPGPRLRFQALRAYTDRLPLIDRRGDLPDMGTTTETAIRSGVVNGVRREIEGYISDFLLKYPRLLVYLTGGVRLDLHISEKMRIFADEFLVPRGLVEILLMN